ncbi:MAG TPA: AraC family transcriptional regulator [Candidatus Limnocylindrales bacterium]|nr:AraC family transcriptional regulator [Candidatus Limnocylindrales bacterium]
MTRTPGRLIETPDRAAGQDPFAVVPQVLELVRLTGAIFFRSEFRAPWAYWAPPAPTLRAAMAPGSGSLVVFHIVSHGQCWVAMDDGIRHEVSQGDVVVMPYGDANTWGSYEPSEPVPIVSLMPPLPWSELPHIELGGDGPEVRVVCGYLSGDAVLFDPVLRALPSLFVVRPPAGPAANWLNASVEYAMTNPPTSRADGARDQRLAESLFTEVLRLYLQEPRNLKLTGWLAALGDPLVGRALSLLHADPAHEWTVDELARSVAASRTVLVDGFVRLLGRPPIRYLTEWRLNLASGLLRTGDSRVGEVAVAVGYSSEEAFSRAFKRAFGASPGHWRDAGG